MKQSAHLHREDISPKEFFNIDPNLLWKEYCALVEVCKFYLNAAIKLSVFSHMVSAAMVAFYLVYQDRPYAKLSLIIPLILTITLAATFLYSSSKAIKIQTRLMEANSSLILKDTSAVRVLINYLQFTSWLTLVVGIFIVILLLI